MVYHITYHISYQKLSSQQNLFFTKSQSLITNNWTFLLVQKWCSDLEINPHYGISKEWRSHEIYYIEEYIFDLSLESQVSKTKNLDQLTQKPRGKVWRDSSVTKGNTIPNKKYLRNLLGEFGSHT